MPFLIILNCSNRILNTVTRNELDTRSAKDPFVHNEPGAFMQGEKMRGRRRNKNEKVPKQ